MNINDITRGVDQNKLNQTLKQLSGTLSKDEINQVLNTLKNSGQNEIKQQISGISSEQLNRMLEQNPALKNLISSNPNFMKNLNSILSNNK